jgi:hypothetical protein
LGIFENVFARSAISGFGEQSNNFALDTILLHKTPKEIMERGSHMNIGEVTCFEEYS